MQATYIQQPTIRNDEMCRNCLFVYFVWPTNFRKKGTWARHQTSGPIWNHAVFRPFTLIRGRQKIPKTEWFQTWYIIVSILYTLSIVADSGGSSYLHASGKHRMLRHQQLQQEDHDSRRASSRGIIPKAKVKTVKMTFVIVFGEFIIASHQAKPFFCFMKVFLLHHTGGKFLENGLKEEIQTLYHKNILTWHMQILCLR